MSPEAEKQAIETMNRALAHPDCSWGFFQCLSQADRRNIDELLVAVGHPLAYEAGNQWNRFKTLHRTGYRFIVESALAAHERQDAGSLPE